VLEAENNGEAAMSEPVLRVEKNDEIAVLTLNRPHALNALSHELRSLLAGTFADLEADPATSVVILTGAGRAFCAGLDLKELGSEAPADIGGGDMMAAIRAFRGPIIGAVNGHAVTGGFELALACDILIAATTARFADTHARVGLLPGWGLSQILPRLIGISRAKEISLTGNFVSAEQSLAWGLVNRVVPPDELLPACTALARDMLSCDRRSLLGYKRLIDEGFEKNFAEAMALEARVSLAHAATISAGSISERREAVRARGRSQATD
jgi:enoyl-CoA hydratase